MSLASRPLLPPLDVESVIIVTYRAMLKPCHHTTRSNSYTSGTLTHVAVKMTSIKVRHILHADSH